MGGFTDQAGMAGGLGALLVGHYEGGRLAFAGRVGTGFTRSRRRPARSAPAAGPQDEPVRPTAAGPLARTAHYVEPRLVCRVALPSGPTTTKSVIRSSGVWPRDADPRRVVRL